MPNKKEPRSRQLRLELPTQQMHAIKRLFEDAMDGYMEGGINRLSGVSVKAALKQMHEQLGEEYKPEARSGPAVSVASRTKS